MKNKSIILLSGGLDSLVCLGLVKEKYNITLALTFNYGQKSFKQEIQASKKLTKYYKINHKIIKLPFLKDITTTSLVSDNFIPENNLKTETSAKEVWVPNRNGLFLNIAAAYADSFGFTHIIFGANKEEAEFFPDNSKKFIEKLNNSFKFSTMQKPKVITPLINLTKNDIVKLALDNQFPLELTRSCYNTVSKNCGKCESCRRLADALKFNGDNKYIKELFENAD